MASLDWIVVLLTVCLIQPTLCSKTASYCLFNLPACGNNERNSTLCCPYKNGVCCTNSSVCCPENSICFPNVGFCMPRTKLGLFKTTKIYSPVPLHIEDSKTKTKIEVCPSKKMICPSKSTCCPGPYIGYDCCPLVHGTCCGDFQHCCPENTTCDLDKGQCVDAYQNKFPWMKKMKADKSDLTHVKKIKLIKNFVRICADQETRCEHNHTCCPTANSKYECCAFANGVCCPGGTHCCPPGTSCGNGTTSDCFPTISEFLTLNSKKINLDETNTLQVSPSTHYQLKSLLNASVSIVCPGGRFTCPDYMTCCKSATSSQVYACCPYPNAVCCSDNRSCCPSGSRCDLIRSRCVRGATFTPIFDVIKTKEAVISKIKTKVNCLDKTTCPDNYTCCQLPSLGYGCCPLPSATCCADKIHCCPHGTQCDLQSGTCKNGNDIDNLPFQIVNKTINFKLLP